MFLNDLHMRVQVVIHVEGDTFLVRVIDVDDDCHVGVSVGKKVILKLVHFAVLLMRIKSTIAQNSLFVRSTAI